MPLAFDNSDNSEQGWFSRERVLLLTLGLSTVLALYLCYLIIQPFIPAVTIAVAAAVATKRPQKWLARRLRSRTAASAAGVLLVAGFIVIPLTLLISYAVRQIIASIHGWQAGGSLSGWRSIVSLPPVIGRAIDWAQTNLDLQDQIASAGQSLASQAGSLVAGSINVVTQLVIMLFVLFFLYRDGDQALDSLHHLVPLSAEEAYRMRTRITDTILAIVNGSLMVALVQALLAGVMYAMLGVPAAVVWAGATFIVALIPVFGTFMVWGPVALYLVLTGSWLKAIILVAWGGLAVATIDNLLYPHLVGGRLRLHTVPTLFAILGGIQLFGPAGLILGPVALAVTIGLLDVWRARTASGRTADQTQSTR
jgi:predicted PurR-regulated permease PerM